MRKLFLAAACLALFATQAHAKCYIREYQTIATIGTTHAEIAPEAGTAIDQTVDPSGGVASSNAFNINTRVVRLICGATVSFVIGASPQTATTSNAVLGPLATEYFAVVPGQVVSFILNANP